MKKIILAVLVVVPCLSAQQSRQGTYRATVETAASATADHRTRRAEITVFRGDERQYAITREYPYDVAPPAIGVFESGAIMIVEGFTGTLEFYGSGGSFVRSVKPIQDAGPNHERVMPFAVHDTRAVVLISEPAQSRTTYVSVSETGDVSTRIELPGQFATAVLVSNDGRMAAAGTSWWEGETLVQKTFVVDEEGNERGSLDVGCQGGEFSPDDSLLLVTTKRQAVLIDLATLTPVGTTLATRGSMIHNGTWAGGSFYILSSAKPELENGEWVYQGPIIQRLEPGAPPVTVKSYPTISFREARIKELGQDVLLELDGWNK